MIARDALAGQRVVGDDRLARARPPPPAPARRPSPVRSLPAAQCTSAAPSADATSSSAPTIESGRSLQVAQVGAAPPGLARSRARITSPPRRCAGPPPGAASDGGCRRRPTSGPGPSRRDSPLVRRSITPRHAARLSSCSTSRGDRSCRLSERSSTPARVSPPPASGSPPRSRALTAPSSSSQAHPSVAGAPQACSTSGHRDRAVLALVVLHQRDQRPPDGHRGAVQRVHVRGPAALRPIADVQPARLEVGRVRGRGELAVALLRRAARPRGRTS